MQVALRAVIVFIAALVMAHIAGKRFLSKMTAAYLERSGIISVVK